MATLVREYILNADNSLNVENLNRLRKAIEGKTCDELTKKTKKPCGRFLMVMPNGFCGCRFHENYSEAIKALNEIEKKDDEEKKIQQKKEAEQKVRDALSIVKEGLLSGSLGVCCDEVYDYVEELMNTIESAINTHK